MYGEVAFNGIQFGEHANLHVKEGDFWFGVHGHLRYTIGVNTDYKAGLLELEHEDCCYGEEAERCKSESLISFPVSDRLTKYYEEDMQKVYLRQRANMLPPLGKPKVAHEWFLLS